MEKHAIKSLYTLLFGENIDTDKMGEDGCAQPMTPPIFDEENISDSESEPEKEKQDKSGKNKKNSKERRCGLSPLPPPPGSVLDEIKEKSNKKNGDSKKRKTTKKRKSKKKLIKPTQPFLAIIQPCFEHEHLICAMLKKK